MSRIGASAGPDRFSEAAHRAYFLGNEWSGGEWLKGFLAQTGGAQSNPRNRLPLHPAEGMQTFVASYPAGRTAALYGHLVLVTG